MGLIDFNELQRQGHVSKERTWFRLRNIHELPDYVALRLSELENDSKGVKVKFTSESERKRAAKLVQKLEKAVQQLGN